MFRYLEKLKLEKLIVRIRGSTLYVSVTLLSFPCCWSQRWSWLLSPNWTRVCSPLPQYDALFSQSWCTVQWAVRTASGLALCLLEITYYYYAFISYLPLNPLIFCVSLKHAHKKGHGQPHNLLENITFARSIQAQLESMYCSSKSNRIIHRSLLFHMHFLNKRKNHHND